jgi:AcrR family transcriptional regulator
VGEVGYARATTKLIAQRAGVAEGTIYRHFPDKEQLLFTAIFERNAPLIEWLSALPDLAGSRTVRENLVELLRRMAVLRNDLLPLELSIRADPELTRRHHEARIRAAAEHGVLPGPPGFVAAYLAEEQHLGRVRPDLDPVATAIVILAAHIGVAMVPGGDDPAIAERLLHGSVDVVVDGITPR